MSSCITTIVNGQIKSTLSTLDRGLQYGDGFFTTMLVVGDSVLNLSAHLRRLHNSARSLKFKSLDEPLLMTQLWDAIDLFNQQNLAAIDCIKVIKIIVSRGEAGRGYPIPESCNPTVIIQVSIAPKGVQQSVIHTIDAFELTESKPIQAGVCSTLTNIQPQLAGLKHLNRLENVLARSETVEGGWDEGIMLNAFNQVIGGTQSNIFLIKDKTVLTPMLALSGVEGTTRYRLSQLCDNLDLDWKETELTLDAVYNADELFFANAVGGIMPVCLVESMPSKKVYSHQVTRQIHQAWSKYLASTLTSLKSTQAIV